MPRDSISRRVARAAATGGSKSYKQRTPFGWYAILMVICVLGLALVVQSRHEMMSKSTTSSTTTTTTTTPSTVPPTASDHWQSAVAVDVCGTVVNLPASSTQATGIATPGNGVVNIQPALAGNSAAEFEGHNATLGKFLSSEGVTLNDTALNLPHSTGKVSGSYHNGDKCEGSPGVVSTSLWPGPTAAPTAVTTDAADLTFSNGAMFMITFLPKGAKVPTPPAKSLVEEFLKTNPSGTVTPSTTLPTSTTTGGTTTTAPTAGATTTTSGSKTTSTTAPSTTTTSSG